MAAISNNHAYRMKKTDFFLCKSANLRENRDISFKIRVYCIEKKEALSCTQ